jgi:hypothetical protein
MSVHLACSLLPRLDCQFGWQWFRISSHGEAAAATATGRCRYGSTEIRNVTDAGVLQQRREYHEEAGDEVEVDTLEVRDFRERSVGAGKYSCHRQNGGDAETNSCR